MRLAMNPSYVSVKRKIIVDCLYISILTVLAILLFVRIYLISCTDVMTKRQRKSDSDYVVDLNLDSVYTPRDVVNCLDTLLKSQNKNLHIVFIGDSVIRNQFTSFIKLIPDYYRTFSSIVPLKKRGFQRDIHVKYHGIFQGFEVSFLWRPLINNKLLSEFKKWKTLEDHQVPYIIFLGVAVHHMLEYNKDSLPFKQQLEQYLIPLLESYLTKYPLGKLVWLIQPPALDRHISIPGDLAHHPEIHSDSIYHYNEVTWRAFQRTSLLVMEFDSFVKEFHRACTLTGFQREDNENYFFCHENHHPQFSVLISFTRHIVFKHVCTLDDDKYNIAVA